MMSKGARRISIDVDCSMHVLNEERRGLSTCIQHHLRGRTSIKVKIDQI